MEVFVAQDTRNQKLIEAIKAIPEPKKEVADEDIEEDKDYIYLMPDGYTDYIDSNNGSRSGYYGLSAKCIVLILTQKIKTFFASFC